MAKYSYTNNGITFNNLDSNPSPKFSIGGKIFSGQNDFEYANEDGVKPVINAVEIDWNGANLSARKEAINSTGIPDTVTLPTSLNTTGELLDIIAQQQAQIDALILMVKGLYVGLAATN